jgi:amino acid permease
MSAFTTHAAAMLEIGGGTIFLLLMICGAAVWVIRNQVSSVFTLLLVFPIALLASMLCYYLCLTWDLFNIKNMGEWLIWTIMSGTVGTFVAIGVAILVSSMIDRGDGVSAARR